MKPKLGFALCGSFCTHEKALGVMASLAESYTLVPILSEAAAGTDTRFGTAAALIKRVTALCGREPITTITEAERLGPAEPLDELLICPCTGNTLSKLANGITDGAVTMAAKAHLRRDRPLLIALASNDALSGSILSLGRLLQRKNVFFVPMRQDDVTAKPHSLVTDFSLCRPALDLLEKREQMRPLFLI